MNYKDTEDMYYNIEDHRYILTSDYIARKYGIQLSDVLSDETDIDRDTLPDRFLDFVSMNVYEYIKEWSSDPEYKMYEASKDKYRNAIQKAMGECVYSLLLNNTDPGLFFQQSHQQMIKTTPIVHTILINSGLLHRGRYVMVDKDWRETKGIDW